MQMLFYAFRGLEMSTPKKVYMDHIAGKPVDSRVMDAMLPFIREFYGNPSSIHSFGHEPRKALEEARAKIAKLINAERIESIIFTSGATESNNMAVKGVAYRNMDKGKHVIASGIEHMSVINPCKHLKTRGFDVTLLPVDKYGLVDLHSLECALKEETVLVSIQYANSEIGTIQPVKEISQIVHRKNAYLHVDATAANGQVPIDVQKEGIDLITLSSNDMYGPKGVGALYIRSGVRIEPIIHGGGQERGLRSGTEDVASMVGFGKAAEIAANEMRSESERLGRLRDKLIKGLLESIPYTFLNGHPINRLPDNAALRFNFIEGESILLSLDMMGVAASSGSACTAKTLEPSHVLLATGLKHEEAHGSVLFTLGRQNTEDEVDYVVQIMPGIVKRLRSMSILTPKDLQS
jgi:cysteine desulfurase